MTLHKPNYSAWSSNELFEYAKETNDELKRAGLHALDIQAEFNLFAAAFSAYDDAIKAGRGLPLTGELRDADAARDHSYSGLRECVTGLSRHYKTDIAAPAAELLAIFKHHPRATSQNYDAESSVLENLLQDLLNANTPGLAALTLLDQKITGGTAQHFFANWAAELRDLNGKFRRLMEERFDLEGQAGEAPSIGKSRPALLETLQGLLEKIFAYALTKRNPAVYDPVLAAINARTDAYNERARARRTRAEHKKEQAAEQAAE